MRILITGGSSDIAKAIARRRIDMGDEVIITSTNRERLQQILESYNQQNMPADGVVFQFENPGFSPQDQKVIEKKPIDALILNAFARMPSYKRFHELPFEVIQQYVSQNIFGNTWLTHHLLPQFNKQQFGRLILISSVSAQTGTSMYGMYSMAKTALEGLFLNLAVDYGKENILANIVRAGFFKTQRTKMFWQRESYQKKMSAIIPQAQMGEPAQLAESLDILLSANSYLNGSVLTVSGGLPLIGSEGLK